MPNRYDTEVGRRVTRMIAQARQTQAGLAELLGVSRSHLNQMITGRTAPDPDLEAQVRTALGLKEDE